jgi:DnaK suppressor protein
VAKHASSKKSSPAKKPVKSARSAARPVAARKGGSATTKPAAARAPKASAGAATPTAAARGKAAPAAAPPLRRAAAIEPQQMINRPQVVPVPTNGKPRKNQAGLTSKELEHFRDLLLQKRRELVGDMGQMEREALRSASGSNLSNLPLHMADMGTDNYEQEFTLGLVEKERSQLREINGALAKIMDGTYGICEGTGKPISKVRLEAQPWSRFSIEYARQMEKGFGR